MKIMVTWTAHPGKLHETLGVFSKMSPKDEEQLMGKNLKLLGRWHDLVRTGRALDVLGVSGRFEAHETLWPIPVGEMDTAPNLVQNPGY